MSNQLTPEEQAELDRLQAKANQDEIAPDTNKVAPDANETTPKPKRQSAKAKRTPEEQAAHEAKVAEARKENIAKANAAREAKKIQAQGKTMDQLSDEEKAAVRNSLRRTPSNVPKASESRQAPALTEAEALALRFKRSPLGKINSAEAAKAVEGRWAEALGGGAKIISVNFNEVDHEVSDATILLSEGGKWSTKKVLTGRAELIGVTAII